MVNIVILGLPGSLCSELWALLFFRVHPKRFKFHLPKIFRRKHLAVKFHWEPECWLLINKTDILNEILSYLHRILGTALLTVVIGAQLPSLCPH